jgi:hypothetical protein
MTALLDNATAHLAHLLLRDTRAITHAKAKEPNSIAPFFYICSPILEN